MRHVFRQDDRELDEATYRLLRFVIEPRRLAYQFLFPFFRDGVSVGRLILNKVSDDLLRAFVVAIHHVATAHVAVHPNGAVVLIQHFAFFVADRDGQPYVLEIIHVFHDDEFFRKDRNFSTFAAL